LRRASCAVVFTPRVKKALSPDDWKRVEATNPLRRMADPEDVAKSILFLSSDLASYANGNIPGWRGPTMRSMF